MNSTNLPVTPDGNELTPADGPPIYEPDGTILGTGNVGTVDDSHQPRFARCRICVGKLLWLDPEITGTDTGRWYHPGSRFEDPVEHDPVVEDTCIWCGIVDPELRQWLHTEDSTEPAEILPICASCSVVMSYRSRDRVQLLVSRTIERRGLTSRQAFSSDDEHGKQLFHAVRLITDNGHRIAYDALRYRLATRWVGPGGLWSTSGVTIRDLPNHRRWMVKAWGQIYKTSSGPDKVPAPAHMASADGYGNGTKVIRLGRDHAAHAEPVMVDRDYCDDIYQLARTLRDVAVNVKEVESVLNGGRVGIVVFERPWFVEEMSTVCVAIQWAIVPDGLWVVPYSHFRCVGLELNTVPDYAMAPFSTGAFLPWDGKNLDLAEDKRHIFQVLVSFFRVAGLPAVVSTRESVERDESTSVKGKRVRSRPLPYRVIEVRRPADPVEYPHRDQPRSDPARDGYKIDYQYDVPPGKVRRWVGKRGNQVLKEVDRKGYHAGPDTGRHVGRETIRRMSR